MDPNIFVVVKYPPSQSDACSETSVHYVRMRRRTESVSSMSSVSSRQTILSGSGIASSYSTKIKTPIIHLPVITSRSLPVKKKVKLPVIHPKHERLQNDFYKLRNCLSVVSNDYAPNYINGRLYYRMIKPERKTVETKPHPFTDYLQRLKLKNELPWRVKNGHKMKTEKEEVVNKKVYFHLEFD